jgi:hypothetical protein
MSAIQNFAASAALQGLIAYLGIMATLLVAARKKAGGRALR